MILFPALCAWLYVPFIRFLPPLPGPSAVECIWIIIFHSTILLCLRRAANEKFRVHRNADWCFLSGRRALRYLSQGVATKGKLIWLEILHRCSPAVLCVRCALAAGDFVFVHENERLLQRGGGGEITDKSFFSLSPKRYGHPFLCWRMPLVSK